MVQHFWETLHHALRARLRGRKESVEHLLQTLSPGRKLVEHRVHFHLVENRGDDEGPFAFLATYSMDSKNGTARHLPLSHALAEFKTDNRRLIKVLSAVRKAARASELIRSFLDTGEIFHPLRLKPDEAHQFLTEIPLYEEAGILCRIPRWWSAKKRTVQISVLIGETNAPRLDADALLHCRAILEVNGQEITRQEAQNLIDHYEGLALIKGRWMAVDRDALEKNIGLFDQASAIAATREFTLTEAMRMLLGNAGGTDAVSWAGSVVAGPALNGILDRLKSPERLARIAPPAGLKAELRPYQLIGLRWLAFLDNLGLGGCMADDMGLGKTIQVLALLLHLKEKKAAGYGPSLLVVPASLIFNWTEEAARFAPSLQVVVAHPGYAKKGGQKDLKDRAKQADLVITTYSMVSRLPWVYKQHWFYHILDEAQAIKNAGTAQAKAVKAVRSDRRLILTGTPVENRVGDIWSLFDFVNHGLLGNAAAFKRFAKTLNDQPENYGRLRRVVQPYILRRLKTDKAVISDLPDKIIMKSFASLSKTQRVLYKRLASELSRRLATVGGMERRGLILAYITKFKQVCNHPDQLAGQGEYAESGSGKFERLRVICESIYEKRERVLVFTQFTEIIPALDGFLADVFGRAGLTLSGATSVKERARAVERFQGESYLPYFVISLKAGGTGLNLTAASHVIHFDRWWNPAVERQAEDRAFRIGQRRNVVVHKFVCAGTMEETIDEMIESKTQLSERVLSDGGAGWITELSDEKLREMFTLRLDDNK